MKQIDLSKYVPTDKFFGAPYIDEDVQWDTPVPHRMIHGGFEGTDTRFRFHFPAQGYQGRMFNPLSGANGGTDDFFHSFLGDSIGGVSSSFRLGGYMVQSNQGHIGDVLDSKAGEDPSIYGWRASAESARFSKYVAAQIYGQPPHHSYVFGGSGGARRSPLCLAYAPGVWDAAMPFMGDDLDGDHNDFSRPRNATPNFACMFNVQRVLGPKIQGVIDAMWPGGSGNPFENLDTHQAQELANLYQLGYPRGDEFMIAQPMGQIWLWSSMAERIQKDPYFEAFWTKPGHVGHDEPQHVERDIINVRVKVARPLTANDLMTDPKFDKPEFAAIRALSAIFAGMNNMMTVPIMIELEGLPKGYTLGAGVKVLTGKAAGRQLYCINNAGKVWLCDGEGKNSNLRFSGLEPGDEVQLDNRAFLAYCYYYRHHVAKNSDLMLVDGQPILPQYEQPLMSPFMGVRHTGRYEGKLMWVHHTHDSSLWPMQGVGFKNNVEREYGPKEAAKKFRLRWTENAEHVPPMMAAAPPGRANSTWLVDYGPVIEQCLADLMAWVEDGIEPSGTAFEAKGGKIILPPSASERGGIQPVVSVTANGKSRADVKVGEAVALNVHAEVPPGAGTIVAVRWDFDGSGTYPKTQDVDGKARTLTLSTTHSFDRPGTYFATALVESHRDGDVNATCRRIPNVASARVVVS